MTLFLQLLSGVCWAWVYIECVRIGFKQKTYAMPAWALALNLGWEILYTLVGFTRTSPPYVQPVIDACWTLLDLLVVYTYLRYGLKYWSARFSRRHFFAAGALMFATCFGLQILFLREFGMHDGPRYAAFLQNLLMSVLFIDMFIKRQGPQGQSLVIAINKWLGTLAPTILYGWLERNTFILATGILCGIYDLIYVGMLLRATPSTVLEPR